MEAQWLADRSLLRTLIDLHPTWTRQELADAVGRSLGWVKKWIARMRTAPPHDQQILHSRSRARHNPPPPLSPLVIERILDIRDHPPEQLRRTPGPLAIRYYLERDPTLRTAGVRLPRSTRTIWQILRQHGRIALPPLRQHAPLERPDPMMHWELDFQDVSTVPPEAEGKQQHVVEVLNAIDVGTSILVDSVARCDFTAETTIQAVVETFQKEGLPQCVTIDRDPRFVGSPQGRDFPAPFVRMLHCLGVQVWVCAPRRPQQKGFVERYNRTFKEEGVQREQPRDLGAVRDLVTSFQQHYNYERPNQALSCHNQPPRVAFPALPLPRQLPATVDPERWLEVLDGQRYVRKVRANGTIKVDERDYYIDSAWAGKYVSVRLSAAERSFQIEYREQVVKQLPIKGLIGERLPLDVYLSQIVCEARHQTLIGRPIGHQLRLPLEMLDTRPAGAATM